MSKIERQETVFGLLQNLRGLEQLKQLFWTELNYEHINQPLSKRRWNEPTAKTLADDPLLFAGGGENSDFHVIYARLASDRLLLSQQRPVVHQLLKDHPYALFIFSNSRQNLWHFVNIKYDEKTEKRRLFRRITISPEERLRTASERIALLDLATISRDLFGLSPLQIQARHDEAFDVEKVTKAFFDEYNAVFKIFQDDLKKQTKNLSFAHDYALQFLNRCMFLYFIQRKGWLGGDPEFLRTFWQAYTFSKQPPDSFIDKWLKVLFFEAFNNKFHGGHRQFPESIRNALAHAPFLNGGLFSENELDKQLTATISDKRFEQIFTFLERYNFTIAEDSPLDQEVAVDPEMIGKVYESLVNVSEEADERGDAGIFYTPRTEIDLMCRLALVDYLTNHLGDNHKSLLNQLVFSLEPDEKAEADAVITKAKLWQSLDPLLKGVTVVDIAGGSGSFLVGMLHILDDLQKRADSHLGKHEGAYERKKRIIGQSLYGVDIMDWACHVAELRLWLALIIDAEFTTEDLHVRQEPLLPHFSFKIRCGDSLVQEVGGINFGHIRHSQAVSPQLKSRITKLKNEKIKFYNNDPDRQFKSEEQIKDEELSLFRDILEDRQQKIRQEISNLKNKIAGPKTGLLSMPGLDKNPHQMELNAVAWQKQIEELKAEEEKVEQVRTTLKTVHDVPFIWDIAFVEIFEDEKRGFDIVIGNPPYVRQENIADPHTPREKITAENKKSYKAKLARSVYQKFPNFFSYNQLQETAAHKLDAKSDLYIYFYFHGISLLNPKGSFCFITSNSWLDVGYGKDLQEFLLKHCHVKMIFDNQVKRSFASADVNTVIVLFSAPDERRDGGLEKTARFVMFKVPFEHSLSPVIFDEIESAHERTITQEYRIHPISQKQLLFEGWEWPRDASEKDIKRFGSNLKGGKYSGNKWGGKYLRAPDVYHKILSIAGSKLISLTSIAEIQYGIKTGLTEFFYIDNDKQSKWNIEKEFLVPFVTSTQDLKTYVINPANTGVRLFMCNHEKSEMKIKNKRGALNYIQWGEKQKTSKGAKHTIAGIFFPDVPSVKGNSPWYSLTNNKSGDFIIPALVRERYFFAANPYSVLVSNMFYQGVIRNCFNNIPVWLILNSTLAYFSLEMLGRPNIGGRLNFYGPEFQHMFLPDPLCLLKYIDRDKIEQAFNMFSSTHITPLSVELLKPEREIIDDLVRSSIGISKQLWGEMKETLLEIVENRTSKEKSL